MKILKHPFVTILLGIALVFVVTAYAGLSPVSFAQMGESPIQAGANAARGTDQPEALFGDSSVISSVTNVLLFLAGSLAVVMVIVGGLRYVTSGGKAASVTAAKNTIMYALVGLIIAFLAFALVNWLLGAISPGSMGGLSSL